MQMLSPFFRQQFFGSDGLPLAGGKVVFNVAGSTSEYKNTYQDALGSVLNTNPVILDSAGVAKIFGIGVYDVYIYTSEDELVESIQSVDFGGSDGSTIGTSIIVANYDALRNLTKDYDLIFVLGRTTTFDGGQGWFEKNTNSGTADDDGIELLRMTTTHYTRLFEAAINPCWYGVVYSSAADYSAPLLLALGASKTYNLPVVSAGTIYINTKMTIKSGSSFDNQGKLVGQSSTEVRFAKGSKFNGSLNCLANNIVPTFEEGVCDALYLSWFTDGTDDSRYSKVAKATAYNYKLYIDVDTSTSEDITLPENLAVDVIGGVIDTITSKSNIDIENWVYTGVGQVFAYQNISYVGTVKLGTGYAYLEWFGGQASTTTTDNSIAFLAALKSGNIYLLAAAGTYYNVPSGTYSTTGSVSITGSIPFGVSSTDINSPTAATLRFSGANVSTGNLSLESARIDGYGSLAVSELHVDNSLISNTIAVSTGLSAISDSLTIDPQYIAVGASGKVILSADASNWTSSGPGVNVDFASIAYSGTRYVAVATTGAVYSSEDGSTWTLRTTTSSALARVKWINSKFIAVGAAGILIYSGDGISWNTTTVSSTFDAKSVSYSASAAEYVVVGTSGSIYVSSDLLTWVKRTVTYLTGTLYDVHCGTTRSVLVGYTGYLYYSDDLNTWYSKISGVTSTLLSVKYYTARKLWVATSSTGDIVKSTDGVNWSTVLKNVTISDSIYDQSEINNQIFFAAGTGHILTTYDLNTFTLTAPVNTYNVYSIVGKTGKVIVIGAGGVIKESSDLQTWTAQNTGTTVDLYNAKAVNGVYYVLGANGTYLTSYDGSTWTVRTIGAAVAFYDLSINADKNLWIAVGATGNIYTTANPIADAPVWTSRTSNVTADLTKVLYNASTWYVYGKSGTILKSTDGFAWTQLNTLSTTASHNALATNGTVIVYVGDGGNIVSTTDGATFVKRTSGVTVNLLSVTYGGGVFVAVGASGTVVTSTDAITWVQRSSSTGSQLNKVAWYGGTFVAVGSGATVIKSTDGTSWSNGVSAWVNSEGDAITVTNNFTAVRYLSQWIIGGDAGGIYFTGDLATWTKSWDIHVDNYGALTIKDFGSLNLCAFAICDNGLVLQARASDVPQWFDTLYVNSQPLNRICGDLIVGNDGTLIKVSGGTQGYPSLSVTPLDPETTDSLLDIAYVNSSYYLAISANGSIKSNDKVNWKTNSYNPTGDIVDVVLDAAGTTHYVLADSHLLSTTDNINFTWIKDTSANHLAYLNSQYYLLLDNSTTDTEAVPTEYGATETVINSGSYSLEGIGNIELNNALITYFVASNGSVLLGSATSVVLTATKATIKDSLLDVPVVNTVAGTITSASIISLAKIDKIDDSTVLNLAGDISGNVSRSKIYTNQAITISDNVSFLNTEFTQNKADTDLFQVATGIETLALTDCTSNLTGLLLYSEDTSLSVLISGGFINTTSALSNGYAKVYLNNVYNTDGTKVQDTAVYSVDGQSYDGLSLAPAEILSTSTSGWYHEQLANITASGNTLVLAHDISMSSTNSTFTLRYRNATTATKLLYELGGKIELAVTYPAGYDKNKQKLIKLKTRLVTPNYILGDLGGYNEDYRAYLNNSFYADGNSSYASTVKDAGKINAITYVWSGHRELPLGHCTRWYDRYGDFYAESYTGSYTTADRVNHDIPGITYRHSIIGGTVVVSADNPLKHAPYIEVYSESNCTLPAGTTIQLTVTPSVTLKNQDLWYGDYLDTSVDPATQLNYKDLYLNAYDTTLDVTKKIAPTSALYTENAFLSLTYGTSHVNGNPADYYTECINSYTWYKNKVRRISVPDPATIYPALTLTGKNVMIHLEGILLVSIKSLNGSTNDGNAANTIHWFPTGQYKQVSDTAYNLLTSPIVALADHLDVVN